MRIFGVNKDIQFDFVYLLPTKKSHIDSLMDMVSSQKKTFPKIAAKKVIPTLMLEFLHAEDLESNAYVLDGNTIEVEAPLLAQLIEKLDSLDDIEVMKSADLVAIVVPEQIDYGHDEIGGIVLDLKDMNDAGLLYDLLKD